jgi:hypothetical protein
VEVLATNVFDKRLAVSSFKQLYHLRWGVEEGYKRLKCRDHVEDFSGTKVEMMMQDFHSAILRMNLTSLVSMKARLMLEEKGAQSKHVHAPNMSLAMAHMQTILKIFRSKNWRAKLPIVLGNSCDELCRRSIPIRPDRIFPHGVLLHKGSVFSVGNHDYPCKH